MKSIKVKFTLVIVAVLLIFASALLAANTFFLDDYYVYKTKSTFVDTADTIRNEFRQDKTEILETIRIIHDDTGYKIQIIDSDFYTVYSSVPEFNINETSALGENMRQIILNNVTDKKDNSYYGIYDSADDIFILFAAKLNNDDYILISQPLNQITKNAQIANDFLLIIGIVMLIASVIIAVIFSKQMIKPILEIRDVADSIARLDFSMEYMGSNKDEIGELGSSINSISKKLNSTISELKDNNEQLINEMKLQKRFVASVSHEFNTPVGLIRGYTEALQLNMYNSEQEKSDIINIIIKEADRLNYLVNDILLLMKLDSKSFSLSRDNIDIIKLINNSADKIDLKLQAKDIGLNNKVDGNVFINADPMRITQVVDNLLSNAVIHTPQGGGVTLSHQISDDFIKVIVNNTGSHINNEDKVHLFDPFYRAQEARSRKKGGSGLGLSIVASIVSSHGGEYGVEDAQDGVSFWFTLPKN